MLLLVHNSKSLSSFSVPNQTFQRWFLQLPSRANIVKFSSLQGLLCFQRSAVCVSGVQMVPIAEIEPFKLQGRNFSLSR